jgi:hypothetical protein
MNVADMPFNIWLIAPTATNVQMLGQVKVLDTYDPSGATFHPEGLFSIPIFGKIGSEARDRTFAYIDLKTKILHPEVYLKLTSIKALYAGIMSGARYAIWDKKEKDFVPATELDGKTGYSFFMSHWDELELKKNESDERNAKIDAINKYKKALLTKHLVSPAGIRDVQIDERGRTTEDEINDLYRKLITISNTIVNSDIDGNEEYMNVPRYALQRVAVQIYQMIKNILSDKRGWFQGKVNRRNTLAGSRNVITAMSTSSSVIAGPNSISPLDTEIGFAQTLRAVLPHTIHALRSGILGQTFDGKSDKVWLINRKTLTKVLVDITPEVMDAYGTRPGIEKLINRFFIDSLRRKPIIIANHYLGLLYKSDTHFKVFSDMADFPDTLDKSMVRPLTLSDLLYTSTYKAYRKLTGTVTRYPVLGRGGIYPTLFKIRTTNTSYPLRELDENWTDVEGSDNLAPAFPSDDPNIKWLDSLTPHAVRLAGLGGDYDGDKCASPMSMSRESRDEIVDYFKTKAAYVDSSGSLMISAAIPTVDLVVANLTCDPID